MMHSAPDDFSLTTVSNRFTLHNFATGLGPIAQLVEPPAHNRSVPGSIPGGPIPVNQLEGDLRQ